MGWDPRTIHQDVTYDAMVDRVTRDLEDAEAEAWQVAQDLNDRREEHRSLWRGEAQGAPLSLPRGVPPVGCVRPSTGPLSGQGWSAPAGVASPRDNAHPSDDLRGGQA